MRFAAISTHRAEAEVATQLNTLLSSGRHIVWFVSGGSCIKPQCRILQSLQANQLSNLTVMLADERYGVPGHANSNYQQLVDAGFVRTGLKFDDLLERGSTPESTVAAYRTGVEAAINSSNAAIATLGIGTDGHTAGILPGFSADAIAEGSVIEYETPQFTRISVSPSVLSNLQNAWVFAYGEQKRPIVEQLWQRTEAIMRLPAQVLYDIPFVTVYNDSIESEGTS